MGFNLLLAINRPDSEKLSPYESGMLAVGDTRSPFSINFYLVSILYLVLDIEILFMYPFLVSLSNVSLLGFWVVILFLFILTVGLIYELGKGALEYAQHSTSSSSNPSQNSPPRPRHLSLVRVGVRRYSTASRCGSPSLEPQFITGLVDAEGYFVISISPSRAYRVGWILQGLLSLQLHVNEIALLNQIQGSFGAGNINLHPNRDVATWVVYRPSELLDRIIPHFEKHPLQSQKRIDYVLWKQVIELMGEKAHLTAAGLEQIVSIRAAINRTGCPINLK